MDCNFTRKQEHVPLIIKSPLARLNDNLHEVLVGTSSALAIRLFGTAIGFFVSVLIARLLGPNGAGVYFLAISVVTILSTVGRVGFDNTVVRFVAAHASQSEWSDVLYTCRIALITVSVASLLLGLTLLVGAEWISATLFNKPFMETPLRIASVAVLPLSFSMILAEVLRGLRRISASQWIKTFLISAGTLALLYPLVCALSANGAIAAYTLSALVTSLIAWLMLQRIVQSCGQLNRSAPAQTLKRTTLFRSSIALFAVALTGLILQHAGTLFLGVWGSAEEVGIYTLALRISSLILFPLSALIAVLAPKVAALHREGNRHGLEELTQTSSRILALFSAPASLCIIVLSDWVLSVFGDEFTRGSIVLKILMIGVLFNLATGAVSNLLMMTGFEKVVRNVTISSSLMVLVLHIILVPSFGMTGAAISSSSGMIIQNSILAWMVKIHLGFFPIRLRRGL